MQDHKIRDHIWGKSVVCALFLVLHFPLFHSMTSPQNLILHLHFPFSTSQHEGKGVGQIEGRGKGIYCSV